MSKELWHAIVLTLLILIVALVSYVAWRFYKLRHPIVVYVPPPEPMQHTADQLTEIVRDSGMAAEHTRVAADNVVGVSKQINRKLDKIEGMMHKVAKFFGVSTDEFK